MVESFVQDVMPGTATAFAYDAAEDRGRRRQVTTRLLSEDRHADDRKRRILSANTRDLARNFEIAAWAIRKHLDYVSSFSFQAKTDDPVFNAELEAFVAEVSRPERCDVAKRHPLRRLLRITEACAVKDGDAHWLKLAGGFNRGMVQGIESDRVGMPSTLPDRDQWTNGIRVGNDGASLAYAICDRSRNGQLSLNRIVPARSVFTRGYYERFDQVRGISPIASALNRFRDTYEGFEYALAKVKVSQLFGLVFTRDAEGDGGVFGTATATADADADGVNDSGYEVNLNRGPVSLDLNPGDDAKILESATPATETCNFLKLMIHVALKSLDIPYSFFDESFTNFYGSRGGLIQYLKSCKDEIADLQDFLDAWGDWRVGIAVADGEFKLPSGKEFTWLDWEWVPDGVPWWDPSKEVRGQSEAIAAGFTSPQRVCRESGTRFEKNIDETAAALNYARERGVPLVFGAQPKPAAAPAEDDPQQTEGANNDPNN